MKLTRQERKIHHKLSKWQYRNNLDIAEQKITNALRHQVGKTNVPINLENISEQWAKARLQYLNKVLEDCSDINLLEFKTEAHKQIITGFERLQDLGFVEVICFKNKEHIVNVVPVWEKKND